MSQQRTNHRPRPVHTYHASPLLSSSTITFLASWRGQLLICTVVVVLGGIYFVLQEPIASYRRRRREALSKAREKELISMEEEPLEREVIDEGKDKRGREKKRDAKKRKASLLRTPGGSDVPSAGPSSIESSPAPVAFKTPKSRPTQTPRKSFTTPKDVDATPTARSSSRPPPQLVLSPPAPITSESTSPLEIPLPPSPMAGPSTLSASVSEADFDDTSNGEEGLSASESLPSAADSSDKRSGGFSIIPEEGYLPPSAMAPNGKKKKRKGRAGPPQPLINLDRDSSPAEHRGPESPAPPMTPSRRARKASLTRPMNADLEELLTDREKTIEALRAEIGLAKAEEAKARDDALRIKFAEDKLKGDAEHARRSTKKIEGEGRRREQELNVRIHQLSNNYAAALQRISALEGMLRDTTMPSTGVPIPNSMPSPVPIQHFQGAPPGSPFGMMYGPSPRQPSAGFVPYPSPGMYPSPMLHPGFQHSPSPFRRASTAGEEGLGGPMSTPQLHPPGSGQYPFDLGVMPLGSPSVTGGRQPSPNRNLSAAEASAADLRRISIESSVLKKKAKSGSDSGEGEALGDINESVGLGVGDVNDVEGTFTGSRESQAGGSGSVDSHRSSPSPPNRASMLLTPASADLFHSALVQNGTATSEGFPTSRAGSDTDLEGIKVIHDAANGNLYYKKPESDGGIENMSDTGSAYEPDKANGHEAQDAMVPMFASLAHTPQQVAEIQRMRKTAIKATMAKEKQTKASAGEDESGAA